MICKIADLIVDVPAAGGLASRCQEYLSDASKTADIVIRPELYRRDQYSPKINEDDLAYMESCFQFYKALIAYNGLYLHASAVELDGRAYLFSGPCRTGKSTHAQIWKSVFGNQAQIINDDKPAIRYINERWYAYGTPWCGKDGINQNRKVPLAGICFLKQSSENRIRYLSHAESLQNILSQTIFKIRDKKTMDELLCTIEKLLINIPVYELENRPNSEAAQLSYSTMLQSAQGKGL